MSERRLEEALKVLREFVADIEAVGVDHVQEEWPDLLPTYLSAKRVLES